MSLGHSPSIVTNGLVFAYDMSNIKKSWKGAPTVNQFSIPTPDGSGNVSFPVNGTGTFQRIYTGNYGGYEIQPTDIVYKYVLGSTGCHYHGNDVTISSGVTATWSCDFYIDPSTTGYPQTNYLANFEGVVGGAVSDPDTTKIGIWKSFTFSSTAGSTGNCRMLLYPGACGDRLATGGFVLFKNPQVEFNSPGNLPTPFVAGTRSTAQAILDLTGRNTLTATSLTYNSDGTFSFNGSNNYIETANNIITGNDPFTFECFYTLTGQTGGEFFGNYGSGYSSSNYIWISGMYGLYIGGSVYFPGAPLANGTYHMACSRDAAGNCVLYKNGVQVTTGTLTGTISAGPNFKIGTDTGGTGEPFSGKIYSQKLYNRVLTAAEVAQNFNAHRGRYGL